MRQCSSLIQIVMESMIVLVIRAASAVSVTSVSVARYVQND